jgi:hypothetical protein
MQREPENAQPARLASAANGIWHPPCRNDALPCKELATVFQEYDSGRNKIPVVASRQREGNI